MPSPKVFVSSTCYDLGMAREQIRLFISHQGFEPVMSEYSDVLYDPRTHTHTSCIQDVPNADVLILIIGSRFGGTAVPEALDEVDIDNLLNSSFDVSNLNDPEKMSITQLETLKAIESGVPVFAFVDQRVLSDHLVYQKNKKISSTIKFPSIEKPDTAPYIFEFINFLGHRASGNSVTPFSSIQDIENHLRKQWAALFQRLLQEQREKTTDTRRMNLLSEKIDDLKTAVISSIGNADTREVARGVLRYRRLLDFASGLQLKDPSILTTSNCSFSELLNFAGISELRPVEERTGGLGRTALIRDDGYFYSVRFSQSVMIRLSHDWQSFVELTEDTRRVINDAIAEMGRMGPTIMRLSDATFQEAHPELFNEVKVEPFSLNEVLSAAFQSSDSSED